MRRTAHLGISLLPLALAALITSGCSAAEPSSAHTNPPSQTSPTTAPPAVSIDWSAPEKAQLPDGWAVADCSGDAPLYCVSRNGTTIGQLERLTFEVATLPDFQAVLTAQGEAAALDDHARRFVADFAKDRAAGCGGDYVVAPVPVSRIATASGSVLRYGFTGRLADGRPSETVVHYAGVRSGSLVLLVANASDPGGCLDGEGASFTSDQLRAFLPLLDQLVTAGGLPR